MKWFSIEGTIGAGKSTLCRMLRERLGGDVGIVEEPVQKWIDIGILDAFYSDPKRFAYTFQTYTFLTRLESILEAVDASTTPPSIQMVERSVFSDRYVFAETLRKTGEISEVEWKMYVQWWTWVTRESMRRVGNPAGFVYLRASPEVAFQRMQKRNRGEESGVPIEYIRSNIDAHDTWLANENTLVIDVDHDFESDPARFEQVLADVKRFMGIVDA